jgi:hypothetical protein
MNKWSQGNIIGNNIHYLRKLYIKMFNLKLNNLISNKLIFVSKITTIEIHFHHLKFKILISKHKPKNSV